MRLVALLLLIIIPAHVSAHKLAPSLLALTESTEERYQVHWKTPSTTPRGVELRPVLPTQCKTLPEPEFVLEGTGVVATWETRCLGGIRGARLGVSGLAESGTAALLKIDFLDGTRVQALLGAKDAMFVVPIKPGTLTVVLDYTILGFEHILSGADHLLFVLALMLLVGVNRNLVWTVTAFTVGHSFTLALAALGYVSYPVAEVEFAIAASILLVALELGRSPNPKHWLRRQPWLAAACFGLLHGMGFAGALLELGLPQGEIVWALLMFNIGIEAGQLAFVAIMISTLALLSRLQVLHWRIVYWLPVYVIGSLSTFWCLERAAEVILG